MVRKNFKNKRNRNGNLIAEVINENELPETDNQELPIEKSPADVTNKSAMDEDLPLNKEAPKVESDLMDVSNRNGNVIARCGDRQSENNIFRSAQVTNPSSVVQKPKIRSLSLKKRGLEQSNDQIPSEPKRTCYDLSETVKLEFIAPGLKNLGNSCYLSSTTQVLYYTPNFRSLIASLTETISNIKGSTIMVPYCRWEKFEFVRRLNKLFEEMSGGCSDVNGRATFDPSAVFEIMALINTSFHIGEQQDVHEFFTCFLSILQDVIKEINLIPPDSWNKPPSTDDKKTTEEKVECLKTREESPESNGKMCSQESNSSNATLPMSFDDEKVEEHDCPGDQPQSDETTAPKVRDFVADLYEGTLERVTKCLECESESKARESFQDLLLNLTLKRPKQSTGDSENDLSDDEEEDDDATSMLNSISEIERLGSCNKYLCLNCNHLVEAERRIRFVKCPQVLIFNLQRSAHSQGPTGIFSKLTVNTGIPLEMNCLEENCPNPSLHRLKLYAVITHSGHSLYSGHYIAYINASLTVNKIQHSPSVAPTQHHESIPEADSENANVQTSPTQPPDVGDHHQDHVWLEMNDHKVKKLEKGEIDKVIGSRVTSNNPYMLFYCRGALL